MPNKRKICTENLNSNQSIYIPSLNSYYPPENVINSAYRKVLDFKENAEKILEKEKSETLCLNEFSKAILDSRSFEISLQHNCIKLKCYITLEKDKDAKKKRNEQLQQQLHNNHGGSIMQTTPPDTPISGINDDLYESLNSPISMYHDKNNSSSSTMISNSGGAKKVNVEVIMKSNPFRVEENEKTTRMELIRNASNDNSMLRFTYYVRPECEAKKFRDTNTEVFEKGRLVVFTNDFFTVYQDSNTGEMNISLNEIVQTAEEQRRTEALGEKLFTLLKDRPRHRALLTNECKLNHSLSAQYLNMASQSSYNEIGSIYSNNNNNNNNNTNNSSCYMLSPANSYTSQEDETFYTRELIHIYGQPIVPSFHKHFNYQLSNTHYGYRTLRRLLNCDILKKYVKITKEEIKSLDRVVEFVQLTNEKCLSAFQLNITSFFDPIRFENGIVKNWLDVWYVDRLKEKYAHNDYNLLNNKDFMSSTGSSQSLVQSSNIYNNSNTPSSSSNTINNNYGFSSSWSVIPQQLLNSSSNNSCFLQASSQTDHEDSECDQANHLWFCLKDYQCLRMEEFMIKLKDYISIQNNKSELILVHTAHPVFEFKDILSESRRILSLFLCKSITGKTLEELISRKFPIVAREHIENLLNKFINFDNDKKIVGFTALFEILLVLKRELMKEKNDEMKYSHFLCTLERANQEKLKMAIIQLKCVPCLNKFTTNINLMNSNGNSSSGGMNCTNNSNNNNMNSKNMVSHANMSRLLKQMSLIVSTELQQIAIDLVERMDEDKPVKFIRLKDEFKHHHQQSYQSSNIIQQSPYKLSIGSSNNIQQLSTKSPQSVIQKHGSSSVNAIQMNNLSACFTSKLDLSSSQSSLASTNSSSSSGLVSPPSTNTTTPSTTTTTTTANKLNLFNPHSNLQQFLTEQKVQELAAFSSSIDRSCTVANTNYSERM